MAAAPPGTAPATMGMARQTGTVKMWRREKGFGFITAADGTQIFVHHSDIKGGVLIKDGVVEFDITQMENGKMKAVNITGAVGQKYDDRRIDPADGQKYSKQQFLETYHGYIEWDAATPCDPNAPGAQEQFAKGAAGQLPRRPDGILPDGSNNALAMMGGKGAAAAPPSLMPPMGGMGGMGGMPPSPMVPTPTMVGLQGAQGFSPFGPSAGAGGKGAASAAGGFRAGSAKHSKAEVHVTLPDNYVPGTTTIFNLAGKDYEVAVPDTAQFGGASFVVDV